MTTPIDSDEPIPWSSSPVKPVVASSPKRSCPFPPLVEPKRKKMNDGSKTMKNTKVLNEVTNKPDIRDAFVKQSILPKAATLTPAQFKTLKEVCDGKSIFLTGPAGSGKSYLLNEIIGAMSWRYPGEHQIAITASTGMAATKIGGITLHQWAGIGAGNDVDFYEKVKRSSSAIARWEQVRVLIIDEVSMIDKELFDKLDGLAKRIRDKKREPFGGIQVILSGDFYQLPPVVERGKETTYVFESLAWKGVVQVHAHLPMSLRQTEEEFCQLLDQLRTASLSKKNIELIEAMKNAKVNEEKAVFLSGSRDSVNAINSERLDTIQNPSHFYFATDSGEASEDVKKKILDGFLAAQELELRQGARVMLIKNLSATLTNGSMGMVQGFERRNTADPDSYPIVQFDNGEVELICKESFTSEVIRGRRSYVLAKRVQVPLLLGWATTIHKAQGQTLDSVVVDLASVRQHGQVYVALSRVREMGSMRVLNFDKKKIWVAEKVKQFMTGTKWEIN